MRNPFVLGWVSVLVVAIVTAILGHYEFAVGLCFGVSAGIASVVAGLGRSFSAPIRCEEP